ncbi:Transcriptional regulator, ArsR family [Fimbriimonas ginsengisoli Gsoil 348]|uniref:Transcriptional regulator, ArsR family n=1 Tax=Fimbriimonas ginsengisoli Gsoil 348 TaxID=661478 RepID=A0A068NM36_FIMGI|nr:Transcriptional regulator, ArsR family [Fimbriimonas ginsengisoli Gsoil 348]
MATLDHVFQALSNPTRRDVLTRLGRGPAAMTELAKPFGMALPSFLQHLQVLEKCGLVRSQKKGRVRVFELETQPLRLAEDWMKTHREQWEARLNQLDAYLLTMEKETND